MAELSAETQAIISELDRQGKLIRTDGRAHSIKGLRDDLSKFTPIFKSIDANIGSLAGKLDAMVKGQLEDLKINDQDIDDELQEMQKEAAALTIKNELGAQKAEAARLAREELARKQKETDDRKKEKEDSKIMKQGVLTMINDNKTGFLKGAIKYGLIGFAGFNILKGVIDKQFDGAFTKTMEGVDWDAIGVGFGQMADFLTNTPWATLGAGLATWGTLQFGVPFVVNSAGELIKNAAMINAIKSLKGVDIESAATPKGKSFLTLRRGLIGMLGAALFAYQEPIKKFIRTKIMGMEGIALENAEADPGILDALGYIGIGATLGYMFGPYGALAGAVLGFAVGLGAILVDNLKDDVKKAGANDEVRQITEKLEALRKRRQELDDYRAMLKEDGLSDSEIDEKVKAFGKSYMDLDEAIADAEGVLISALDSFRESNEIAAQEVENRKISDTKFVGSGGYMASTAVEVPKTPGEIVQEARNNEELADQMREKNQENTRLALVALGGQTIDEVRLAVDKRANERATEDALQLEQDVGPRKFVFGMSQEDLLTFTKRLANSESPAYMVNNYVMAPNNIKQGDQVTIQTDNSVNSTKNIGFAGNDTALGLPQ